MNKLSPTVRYIAQPHEDRQYLRNFFEERIKELILIKRKLLADKKTFLNEIPRAKNGESRYSLESIDEIIWKLDEQIKDVDDNLATNRFHLYDEDIQ